MGTEQSNRTPRSLADDLRQRTPGEIQRLLELRPDLLDPWPTDMSGLARRAAEDASVLHAVNALSTPELRVLEVFAALHEATFEQIDAALPEDPTRAIAALREQGLIWGGPVFKIVRAAQSAFGAFPCGLSAASHLSPDPQVVADDALDIDPDRLRYLVWEHPVSTTANPLTVVRGDQHVVPREVSLILRKGAFLPPVTPPVPPEPAPAPAPAVWNVLAGVRYVLTDLAREPLPWHPQRGVSRRVLADRAGSMAVPLDELVVWLELAAVAGLIGAGEAMAGPTAAASTWLADPGDDMWQTLVSGWLDSDRPLPACRPDALGCLTLTGRARTAALRRQILSVWPTGRITLSGLREVLAYQRPRLSDAMPLAEQVYAELTALGLLVGGVASEQTGSPATVQVPAVDNTLIVQPDLTLIAPANVDTPTWELLTDVARVESWGPVIGMRIDPAKLRTAVLRRPPEQLLELLSARSRTPLPQSLHYLAKDAARGAPAQVSRVTLVQVADGDRQVVQELGWREIAEGAFVADVPTVDARRLLADAGIATTGTPEAVAALPLDYQRTASPSQEAVDRLVALLVDSPAVVPVAPELVPADPATLREILRAPRVWLEFNDGQRALTHLVEPLEVRAGRVSAWSLTQARTVSIPLSRIVAVRIAE